MSGVNNVELPLVSVIINCYNGEVFLKEAIESVFQQTYTNWEIIFWDNCSNDKSAEIAKSFGEKIKYFYSSDNTSLGEARNMAIQKSSGDFIAFIDCDDIWINPRKLEIQVDLLMKNESYGLCYGSMEEIDEEKNHFRNVITIHESGYIFPELLMQFDVSIITTMIRKKTLEQSGLNFDNNIKASEEYCLFMQLACISEIGVIKDILAAYRVSMNSLTSKSLEILGFERRYTLKKIIDTRPFLLDRHSKNFREAFARANYYDARWNMHNRNRINAIKNLSKNILINKRYFLLFIITLFPYFIWDLIHLAKRKRV